MVVSGIAGWKKQQYSLFGDCVNTASRMQSCARPFEVRVTSKTFDMIKDELELEAELERVEVKVGRTRGSVTGGGWRL